MKKGKNRVARWSSKGGGMRKHRVSGVPHNHALSIARVREENERLAKEQELRAKRKGKLFSSVKEAFKNK